MKLGANTLEELARLDGPPSRHDQRSICAAMIRDGHTRWASELAASMLGSEVPDRDFYFWLGLQSALHHVEAREHELDRQRRDRSFKRLVRRHERQIKSLGTRSAP